MKEYYLKDIKSEDGDVILEWPYIELFEYFVFYKPQELDKNDQFHTGEKEKLGFKFMSLEIVGRWADKPMLYPENDVHILYHGSACFDGRRHLYLGDEQTENYGYIYYPTIKTHIKLLEVIRQLEEKYCRDIDR